MWYVVRTEIEIISQVFIKYLRKLFPTKQWNICSYNTLLLNLKFETSREHQQIMCCWQSYIWMLYAKVSVEQIKAWKD